MEDWSESKVFLGAGLNCLSSLILVELYHILWGKKKKIIIIIISGVSFSCPAAVLPKLSHSQGFLTNRWLHLLLFNC